MEQLGVKFTPSYFDASEPFGVAWGQRAYFKVRVDPPDITAEEGRHDYAVVVLDRRIGDVTGWMGSQVYSDSWDDVAYGGHAGYPGDLAGGRRPSFQGNIAPDGSDVDPLLATCSKRLGRLGFGPGYRQETVRDGRQRSRRIA
jgi:hypothetical protein